MLLGKAERKRRCAPEEAWAGWVTHKEIYPCCSSLSLLLQLLSVTALRGVSGVKASDFCCTVGGTQLGHVHAKLLMPGHCLRAEDMWAERSGKKDVGLIKCGYVYIAPCDAAGSGESSRAENGGIRFHKWIELLVSEMAHLGRMGVCSFLLMHALLLKSFVFIVGCFFLRVRSHNWHAEPRWDLSLRYECWFLTKLACHWHNYVICEAFSGISIFISLSSGSWL